MKKVSGFLHFTQTFPTEQSCIEYYEKLRKPGIDALGTLITPYKVIDIHGRR